MKKKRITPGSVAVRIVLYAYALLVLFPIFWIVYTSFKTNKEFVSHPWALPEIPQFENYINAWAKVNFNIYTMNSIFITAASVVLAVVLSAMAAYVLMRFRFRFNKAALFIFLSGLYVPVTMILTPEFLLLNDLHLLNNRFALVLLYVVFSLPYSILVMTAYYKDIPLEIEEAAYIDGCSYNRTFWSVVFPISRNGLATIAIYNILWIWNDYIFALTFITSKEKRTLPVGLIGLMESFRLRMDWVTLFAGLNIVMIPSIIVYIIFRKTLASGLIAGSVKG